MSNSSIINIYTLLFTNLYYISLNALHIFNLYLIYPYFIIFNLDYSYPYILLSIIIKYYDSIISPNI